MNALRCNVKDADPPDIIGYKDTFAVRVHRWSLRRDKISVVKAFHDGTVRRTARATVRRGAGGHTVDAASVSIADDDIALDGQHHVAQGTLTWSFNASQQLSGPCVIAEHCRPAPIRLRNGTEALNSDLSC